MLISTTEHLETKKIKEYRGVIFGETIIGIDFIKDFTAGITNVIGGKAEEYEEELVNARADAINEMMIRAKKIGANAIVGVSIDVESISVGQNNSLMLMVSASGTAVILEEGQNWKKMHNT